MGRLKTKTKNIFLNNFSLQINLEIEDFFLIKM